MEKKASWYEAITHRTSRRTYLKEPLEPIHVHAINQLITNINIESGLRFQILEDSSQFLKGFKKSYGMFKNVQTVIALVGDKERIPNMQMQIGYYGQFLMLECVSLNLGTCWIGGTFDKKATKAVLNMSEQEELYAIISVGKVPEEKTVKEKLISRLGKNKQTADALLLEKEEPIPSWVYTGIEAARLAPSAVNGKPVGYTYLDKTVKGFITKKNHNFELLDLGISLAHFELGALHVGVRGTWIPENNSKNNETFIFQQQ